MFVEEGGSDILNNKEGRRVADDPQVDTAVMSRETCRKFQQDPRRKERTGKPKRHALQ